MLIDHCTLSGHSALPGTVVGRRTATIGDAIVTAVELLANAF